MTANWSIILKSSLRNLLDCFKNLFVPQKLFFINSSSYRKKNNNFNWSILYVFLWESSMSSWEFLSVLSSKIFFSHLRPFKRGKEAIFSNQITDDEKKRQQSAHSKILVKALHCILIPKSFNLRLKIFKSFIKTKILKLLNNFLTIEDAWTRIHTTGVLWTSIYTMITFNSVCYVCQQRACSKEERTQIRQIYSVWATASLCVQTNGRHLQLLKGESVCWKEQKLCWPTHWRYGSVMWSSVFHAANVFVVFVEKSFTVRAPGQLQFKLSVLNDS